MSNINWTGDRGDYTAQVESYTLRAECLVAGMWWWCCYFPDGAKRDVYTDKWAETEEQAKAEAVRAMNEHQNTAP